MDMSPLCKLLLTTLRDLSPNIPVCTFGIVQYVCLYASVLKCSSSSIFKLFHRLARCNVILERHYTGHRTTAHKALAKIATQKRNIPAVMIGNQLDIVLCHMCIGTWQRKTLSYMRG